MSVAADIWKQIVHGTDAAPPRKSPARATKSGQIIGNTAELSLVHQLFFPDRSLHRKSVLLAAADEASDASFLSLRLATTLAAVSGRSVGIIETLASEEGEMKSPPTNGLGRTPWQAWASSVSENVWRIPVKFACAQLFADANSQRDRLTALGFDYFLLSVGASDSSLPVLCRWSEAAVLVVTANVTRRDAALAAKERLLQLKATLAGVVLDQRTLPVPESVYRRL